MPTKIRLARHGRKRYAYYHIVVADSRAPRDGRFIERIGSYNPNNDPATIDLDFDRAFYWVTVGAQPTDTVRTILSKEGVLFYNHLVKGVAKGAFSQEEAEKRFNEWKKQKETNKSDYVDALSKKAAGELKERLEIEKKLNDERQAAIDAQKAEAAKAAAKANAPVEEQTEEVVENNEATESAEESAE